MALATKADLATKAASWLRRAGSPTYVAEVADFIALAEAKLNRLLGPAETDAALTGVVGSRQIDISAIAMVEPIALWFTPEGGGDEDEVTMQSADNMAFVDGAGAPTMFTVDSQTALKLDRTCDQVYGFRFRFQQRFALTDDNSTNWLLQNHPDVYLAATLMWGAGYLEAWANGQVWKSILAESVPEVANILAAGRRGMLRVDSGLQQMASGSRRGYNIFGDR